MTDWKPEIRRRLADLRFAPTREAAIVEELAQYLDDYYAELLAGAATEAEAYHQTLTELHGSELLAHELRRTERQVPQEPLVLGTNRRTNMIADFWQDLRYGMRMLRRAPGFTAVAALALALGIGVNTSILSIVNAFVLRPLPVEKPSELVVPFWGSKKDAEVWGQFSYANYIDLRDQNKTLSGLLAWQMVSAGISSGEGRNSGDGARAEVAWGELVSGNYFDVLGVKPSLGRGFLPEEDRAQNTHPVVVLGYAFWRRRFNSDAAIVGKTIFMNGSPFMVIGVAPATFKGLEYGIRQDFWAPLMMQSKFNCADLFLRSLNKAINTELGFSTENLVTMMVNTDSLGYNPETGKRFYGELLRRIEQQPGVRAASLTQLPLLNDYYDNRPVLKEGEGDPPPNQGLRVNCNVVAPRYFETIRTPLALGRDFTERDNSDAPLVAIINQEYARKFYGGEQNALGKRIRIWNSQTPLIEIVGVAKDALYQTLYDAPQPYLFLPQFQQYNSEMTLLVSANVAGDLKAVAESVRREIGRLDSRVPVFGVKMAEENLSYAYWGPRLAAGMGTAFGLLALLLSTMGLYSVMTYAVSQRTREIGVRIALGAQIRDVLKLIVSQGMKLALIGIVIGLVGAFAVTRVVSSLLFGVGATDPITFAGVAILLVAVALLACWIPARRATKVDPLVALRHD